MGFDEFYVWVYKELNINLSAYKPIQLNRRIDALMTKLGIKNLEEYTKIIKSTYEERQRFLDYITINVTEFFRNPNLFLELKELLKIQIEKNKEGLKIWSAACSIGCEPYTLALILKEIDPNIKHRIIATDIDRTILQKAIEGIYSANEMKNISKEIEMKYFTKLGSQYAISKEIKKFISFRKHDLIIDNYEKNYDLIVCRNVIIYFKNEVKKEIFRKFSDSLKSGGFLFVGATESVYDYKEYGFEKESTFIYKKV